MESELAEADAFELTGVAEITYQLSSGELHYRGPTRPPLRDFVEVKETTAPVDTPIGRLVTATLRSVADGDTSTVTVLLPEVNLALGDETGHDPEAQFETVAVFTTSRSTIGGTRLVKGPIQDYAHAAMKGTARRSGAGRPCSFRATFHQELPGPGRLTVEGECIYPTTGFKVELKRHEPQGFNPADLLLDLVVTRPGPDEIVGQAFTKYPVRYEEQADQAFETVTLLPDGPSVDVDVIT